MLCEVYARFIRFVSPGRSRVYRYFFDPFILNCYDYLYFCARALISRISMTNQTEIWVYAYLRKNHDHHDLYGFHDASLASDLGHCCNCCYDVQNSFLRTLYDKFYNRQKNQNTPIDNPFVLYENKSEFLLNTGDLDRKNKYFTVIIVTDFELVSIYHLAIDKIKSPLCQHNNK